MVAAGSRSPRRRCHRHRHATCSLVVARVENEVEEEEEENTDFIEITDDENVAGGVSESPIYTKRQNVS